MTVMKMFKPALAVLLTLCVASSANAATVLFFNPTSSTTTTVGGPAITVNLVLSETVTTNINQFGIAGASFKINRSGSGSLGTPIGNAAFDASIAGGADPSVTLNQTSIFGVGQGSSQVVLGSFLINATSAGSGSLSVSAFGNLDDIVVYTDNLGSTLNLSPAIFASVPNFNYSITAVPEPGSASLLLLAASTFACNKLRKKFQTKKSKNA